MSISRYSKVKLFNFLSSTDKSNFAQEMLSLVRLKYVHRLSYLSRSRFC